jgi:hypothetical protein
VRGNKETDMQIEIDKVQTAHTIVSVGPNRRLNFYGDSTEGERGEKNKKLSPN